MLIKNMWLHFKKVCKHKHYVRKYCWKLGLYKQGIMHDMSKFSPIEFFESAKYYQGDRSPIDACKEINGYSRGWQHHKGNNPHHYEYWVDDLDHGGKPLIMPEKYAMELIADYLGAGHAYMGKNFTYKDEYEWWKKKQENPLMMHPVIKYFIDCCLKDFATSEKLYLNKEHIQYNYHYAIKNWTGMEDMFW